MADDRHYVGGDYYQLDDLSGFKIRASRSRKIPGGQTGNLIVAPERWEPQQPQDFVRGVIDDQTVPQPRPRQANQFTVLGTQVIAPAPRGATSIMVEEGAGFTVGMTVQIMLDSGENFLTSLQSIVGDDLGLNAPLPFSVGTLYGDPIENAVLALSPGDVLL
ncbi:MAG TPA: hypothetical protein VKT26_03745 [Acetobacteraceae bacterium]|nr:hypothetical protein [Acetobacteraceae bacterium]